MRLLRDPKQHLSVAKDYPFATIDVRPQGGVQSRLGCSRDVKKKILTRREACLYTCVLHREQAFGVGMSAARLAPAWLAQVLGSAIVLRVTPAQATVTLSPTAPPHPSLP